MAMNSVHIEGKGIPIVYIGSSAFYKEAAGIFQYSEATDIPILVYPAPLEKNTDAELKEKADGLFPQLWEALTLPSDKLREKYGYEVWLAGKATPRS